MGDEWTRREGVILDDAPDGVSAAGRSDQISGSHRRQLTGRATVRAKRQLSLTAVRPSRADDDARSEATA